MTKSGRRLIGGLHKLKRLYLVRDEPFSLWTSLGLNQGPPDYESVALTN